MRNGWRCKAISGRAYVVPGVVKVIFPNMAHEILSRDLQKTPQPHAYDSFRFIHPLDPMDLEVLWNVLVRDDSTANS